MVNNEDLGFNGHGSGVKVEIEGLSAIIKDFDSMANMDHYKPILKTYTNRTASLTQKLMGKRYTGHWEYSKYKHGKVWRKPTGTTRRSTLAHITDDGMTGYVQAQEEHWQGTDNAHKKRGKAGKALREKDGITKSNSSGTYGKTVPGTSYFPYLEYGTRYMKARPTLGPAFELRSKQFAKAIDDKLELWSKHTHF